MCGIKNINMVRINLLIVAPLVTGVLIPTLTPSTYRSLQSIEWVRSQLFFKESFSSLIL